SARAPPGPGARALDGVRRRPPPTPPVPGGGAPGGWAREAPRAARRRRAPAPRRRWAGPAGLLIFAGLVTASVLALGSLPHGGLLVLALLLVLVPVTLLAALAGALVWIGLRAWRSGARLEVVPIAAGVRRRGRAAVGGGGRPLWRAGGGAGGPRRPRHGRYHHHGYAHYQRTTGGPWHQARVGDLSGTTR